MENELLRGSLRGAKDPNRTNLKTEAVQAASIFVIRGPENYSGLLY
jgi:hypothetical protein